MSSRSGLPQLDRDHPSDDQHEDEASHDPELGSVESGRGRSFGRRVVAIVVDAAIPVLGLQSLQHVLMLPFQLGLDGHPFRAHLGLSGCFPIDHFLAKYMGALL